MQKKGFKFTIKQALNIVFITTQNVFWGKKETFFAPGANFVSALTRKHLCQPQYFHHSVSLFVTVLTKHDTHYNISSYSSVLLWFIYTQYNYYIILLYYIIDLQKAFDTVDHSILLHKLNHYGIRGVVNDWFLSYLSGRVQTTQIGSYISQKEKTLCGVPQGSVLGPLLFLIYINDIYNASDKLAFYLFADDTNLLFADRNLQSLETVVNMELMNVSDWLASNKLSLNVKKTNFVIFHPSQKRLDYKVNLKIYDNNRKHFICLERKDYVKYLGVLIDSNLPGNIISVTLHQK